MHFCVECLFPLDFMILVFFSYKTMYVPYGQCPLR